MCNTPEHRKKYIEWTKKYLFEVLFLCVCSRKFVRKTISSLSFKIFFFTGFRNILIILILVHESWSGMILNVIQKRKRKIFFYNIEIQVVYWLVIDRVPEIGFFGTRKCVFRQCCTEIFFIFCQNFGRFDDLSKCL